MAPLGIKPVAFCFVAQCLNQVLHHAPPQVLWKGTNISEELAVSIFSIPQTIAQRRTLKITVLRNVKLKTAVRRPEGQQVLQPNSQIRGQKDVGKKYFEEENK